MKYILSFSQSRSRSFSLFVNFNHSHPVCRLSSSAAFLARYRRIRHDDVALAKECSVFGAPLKGLQADVAPVDPAKVYVWGILTNRIHFIVLQITEASAWVANRRGG